MCFMTVRGNRVEWTHIFRGPLKQSTKDMQHETHRERLMIRYIQASKLAYK
jgi:hypothetical protein